MTEKGVVLSFKSHVSISDCEIIIFLPKPFRSKYYSLLEPDVRVREIVEMLLKIYKHCVPCIFWAIIDLCDTHTCTWNWYTIIKYWFNLKRVIKFVIKIV